MWPTVFPASTWVTAESSGSWTISSAAQSGIRQRENEVGISASQMDDHILVRLSDEGNVISAEDQMKLFQTSERLDNASMKTAIQDIGFGLIACRRVVAALGERI
jgi:K+-sensing histidine kinase KdpD